MPKKSMAIYYLQIQNLWFACGASMKKLVGNEPPFIICLQQHNMPGAS